MTKNLVLAKFLLLIQNQQELRQAMKYTNCVKNLWIYILTHSNKNTQTNLCNNNLSLMFKINHLWRWFLFIRMCRLSFLGVS